MPESAIAGARSVTSLRLASSSCGGIGKRGDLILSPLLVFSTYVLFASVATVLDSTPNCRNVVSVCCCCFFLLLLLGANACGSWPEARGCGVLGVKLERFDSPLAACCYRGRGSPPKGTWIVRPKTTTLELIRSNTPAYGPLCTLNITFQLKFPPAMFARTVSPPLIGTSFRCCTIVQFTVVDTLF
ncbi:hypothetical protein ABZP36_030128 [Zizania latifolia]